MNRILIGFSKPKRWKPFAWAIMKAYGTSYDHVYIKIHSDKYNRDLIYQASKIMVNFMGIDVFLSANEIIKEFTIDVSEDNYIKMMQFAIDNAGKPYGYKTILGLGIVRIAELFGKKIKNPFDDDEYSYVCCKLVGYIIEDFSENNKLNIDPDDLTPLDVYNYLSQIEGK